MKLKKLETKKKQKTESDQKLRKSNLILFWMDKYFEYFWKLSNNGNYNVWKTKFEITKFEITMLEIAKFEITMLKITKFILGNKV